MSDSHFSSLSFFVITLLDINAGTFPNRRSAVQWADMLETKTESVNIILKLDKSSNMWFLIFPIYCLLCSAATKLQSNGVQEASLRVRELSVSRKKVRWKTIVIVLHCVFLLISRPSDRRKTTKSNKIDHHRRGNALLKQAASRMASKQRNATAKEAHGAYWLLFWQSGGSQKCFQVPVTVIDVCFETLTMTCISFGVHFLSTSIEIQP